MFLSQAKGLKGKLAVFVLFLLSSYVITILVNSSRIICAILVLSTGFITDPTHKDLLHKALGVVVYFFSLVTCYLITSKIIVKVSGFSETSA